MPSDSRTKSARAALCAALLCVAPACRYLTVANLPCATDSDCPSGSACGSSGLCVEGLAPDAGTSSMGSDAGMPDAGGPAVSDGGDAGTVDSGPADAGPQDSGPADAGVADSGPVDSGPVDSGPPPAAGVIEGIVSFPGDGGTVVAGGHVVLENSNLATDTSAGGQFSFTDVPAGMYAISVTASRTGNGVADNGLRVTGIVLTSEVGRNLGSLTLGPFGQISGQVIDGDGGSPVLGATAVLDGVVQTPVVDGGFTFSSLLPGTYNLSVLWPVDGGSVFWSSSNVAIASALSVDLSQGQAATAGILSGQAQLPLPATSSGLTITLLAPTIDGGTAAVQTTGPSGTYSTATVPAGIYSLIASAPDGGPAVSVSPLVVTQSTNGVPFVVVNPLGLYPADAGPGSPDAGSPVAPEARAACENLALCGSLGGFASVAACEQTATSVLSGLATAAPLCVQEESAVQDLLSCYGSAACADFGKGGPWGPSSCSASQTVYDNVVATNGYCGTIASPLVFVAPGTGCRTEADCPAETVCGPEGSCGLTHETCNSSGECVACSANVPCAAHELCWQPPGAGAASCVATNTPCAPGALPGDGGPAADGGAAGDTCGAWGLTCNAATTTCAPCSPTVACPSGETCVGAGTNTQCITTATCMSGLDCQSLSASFQQLPCISGSCAQCAQNSDCLSDQYWGQAGFTLCQGGNCVQPVVDSDGGLCSATQNLCSGNCTDLETDPKNCGGCGTTCASGIPCQNGLCNLCVGIDLTSDPKNCGLCGNACPAGVQCEASVCAVCTGDELQARTTALLTSPIQIPNRAAGLDLAGFVGSGTPTGSLNAPWAPGDPETWQRITAGQAELVNCQGTPLGQYFGGDSAVAWGSEEVVLETPDTGSKAGYLGLNYGYLGELDFHSVDGMTKYAIRLDGTPVQISQGGGALAPLTLDWQGAQNGNTAAVAVFDDMYRAISWTYFPVLPPEPPGLTCVQTGDCAIGIFSGQGGGCVNAPLGAGVGQTAYFDVPDLGWVVWAQGAPTANSNFCRMDINFEQIMNYSSANVTLKLDAQGPTTPTQIIGSAMEPCQLALGMRYEDFLANCVQNDPTTAGNTAELQKLTDGTTHDQETYNFNIPGLSINFAASSQAPTEVVEDGQLPAPTDTAISLTSDGSTLGLYLNNWTIAGTSITDNLQGAGALYYQFKQLAITTIYGLAAKTLPTGGADALIASCIAPRPAPGNIAVWPPGTGSFNPSAWQQQMQAAGCTGLETLLTALQTYQSDGVTPNNDDPTNLGEIDTGIAGAQGIPAPVATVIAQQYTQGMKPGAQQGAFCLDSESANEFAASDITPQSCTLNTLVPAAFNQVVTVMGGGTPTTLPLPVQDPAFFFRMYGQALIQTLESTAGNPPATGYPFSSPPPTWGTGGSGSPAPISAMDLSFVPDAANPDVETMTYVDRRFVCPAQASSCADPQPPLQLSLEADVGGGIIGTYQFTRWAYRGDTAVATVMQDPGFSPGRESNQALSNIFGAAVLQSVFPQYACATTLSTAASSSLMTTCNNVFPDTLPAGTPTDTVGAPIDFTHYQGAWSPTALALGPTAVRILATGTPSGTANVQFPEFGTVYGATGSPSSYLTELLPWEAGSLISGASYPVATAGGTDTPVAANALSLDSAANPTTLYYEPETNPLDPSGPPIVKIEAVKAVGYFGDVFLCADPTSKSILAVPSDASYQLVLAWLNQYPSAATACQIVTETTTLSDGVTVVPTSVSSLKWGVRLDFVTDSAVNSRVIDAILYPASP